MNSLICDFLPARPDNGFAPDHPRLRGKSRRPVKRTLPAADSPDPRPQAQRPEISDKQ
ncbi:hypothetical protein I552_3829 [Mycobacterium xenopi 3993]|nr:hypothetical protein I552_3829 [Mycobacterium xenopi 3993]